MVGRNPYEILGVEKTAGENHIKDAYKKMALKNHPDRPDGDEGKMKDITWARDLLLNKNERGLYDKYGAESTNQYEIGIKYILKKITKETDSDNVGDPYDRLQDFLSQCDKAEVNIAKFIDKTGKDLKKLKEHKNSEDVKIVIMNLQELEAFYRQNMDGCRVNKRLGKEIKKQFERAIEILGRKSGVQATVAEGQWIKIDASGFNFGMGG